ncbi:unnamed protein product, partial [Mesorhabditis belari]|uniref:Uncharacterized protein n=1 Tax=Mesorhabditis belari TaxID=2138241 RepID=A0AAF3F923_9BILA
MKDLLETEQVFSWEPVQRVLDFIENMTGVQPEHVKPEVVDLTRIPDTHFWWFYVEDEDEEDEADEENKTTATNTEEPNRNLNQINKLLETLSDAESYLKALQEVPLSQGSRQMGFSKMQRLLAAVLIISKESSLRKHFFFLVNILVVFEKKTLLPHELMRFSANTLFFLNIHIEVGKAIKLFTDFNRKNIDHIAEKMTDEQTKQVFTEFLARNKDSSGYYSKRVIKAINYMDNPEEFFQQTSQLSLTVDLNDIDRSVIVKDLDGYTQKIDLANKRIQFTASTPKIPVTIKAKSTKLLTALGGTLEKHKYLSKLTNHDRARINYAIGGAANYKRDFIEAAETLANQLETKMSIGAGEFLSLVEIVAAEKRKDKDSGHVRNFLDAYVINQLVEGILSDLTTIDQIETELDTQGKVSSINQITAIYENGLKKILYQWTFLLKNDAMLAINYSNDGVTPPTISTIFKTPDVFKEYENRFLINEETYKALLIKLCQSMQGFNLDISSIPNPALKESMVSLIQNE